MGKPTVEPNQNEIELAKFSTENFATHCGLDLNDPKVRKFVDNCIANKAQDAAWIRFLQNIVHKPLNGGDNAQS